MKWWQTPQNCFCIFAFDAESDYTKDTLYFSNNPNRHLKTLNGEGLLERNTVSGFKHINLERELPAKAYTYNSLKINNTNLLFDIPISIPNEFTMVLKVKVNESSIFLSNNGSNYGLTFGTGEYNASSDSAWRVDGFRPEGDYTKNQFDLMNKGYIQTVVLKGNILSKDITLITDYGVFKFPQDSSAFINFFGTQSYTTFGYSHTHSMWRPKADIIAYGLFDKVLSEDELGTLFSAVDNMFLKDIVLTYTKRNLGLQFYKTSNNKNNIFFKNPSNILLNIKYIKNPKYNPEVTNKIQNILSFKPQEILYKNTQDIIDIVLKEGLPIRVKLYLYEKSTGYLLKTTMSDLQGNFSFLNLKKDFEYIVTANDPQYQFKSIIKNYNS